jgi:hypothetical protein
VEACLPSTTHSIKQLEFIAEKADIVKSIHLINRPQMSSITVSAKEIADTKRLAGIITDVEKKQNDFDFANRSTDDIYQYQPFLLSVIMGYKMDLPPAPLDALVKLYIILWEYFKNEPNVRKVTITQQQYEKAEDIQVSKLQTLDRLTSAKQKETAIANDLNKSASKALLALIFTEFKEKKVLKDLDQQTKAILLIGFKSFIQCFEDIIARGKNI